MVNIARAHNDKEIVESLKKLRSALNFADGEVTEVEVDDPTPKRRYINLTVRFLLEAHEFDQVLEDSLEAPKARAGTIL